MTYAALDSVVLRANLRAQNAMPPLTDDQASSTTPLVPDAAISIEVVTIDNEVTYRLYNAGPYHALSTESDPIVVQFQPAPGVHVDSPVLRAIGNFRVQTGYFSGHTFALTFDGSPPAQLGVIVLDPGPNRVTGPTSVPVFYRARPDLGVATWREPGVVAVGGIVPVTVEVENVGAGAAENANIDLIVPREATWTPPVGTIAEASYGYVWTIPSLAAGAKITLSGVVAAQAERSFLTVSSEVFGDINRSNDYMSVEATASPNGTADLQIAQLDMTGLAPPYHVRANIVNAGPVSAPEGVTVSSGYGGATARVVQSDIAWFCGSGCSSRGAVAPGSNHTLEIQIGSELPADGFAITVEAGSGVPDPDPRNNRGRIRR